MAPGACTSAAEKSARAWSNFRSHRNVSRQRRRVRSTHELLGLLDGGLRLHIPVSAVQVPGPPVVGIADEVLAKSQHVIGSRNRFGRSVQVTQRLDFSKQGVPVRGIDRDRVCAMTTATSSAFRRPRTD
jgi:hypothetical protein